MEGYPETTERRGWERSSSVERALDILSLFARSGSSLLGVTEIAQSLELSKTVVHRTLSSLSSRGYVELDKPTRRYRLGYAALILGLTELDRIDVHAFGRAELAELVATTNETATLSVRVGWQRVYLDQVAPKRDVRMVVELGQPFPLHAGASSKALLAYLPQQEQEEYLEDHYLAALTPQTITDPDRLRRELKGVRSRGYAVSFGERDSGAGSVAAPVFSHDGSVVAVLSVSGPLERFSSEVEQASQALLAAQARLSRRLGYRDAGKKAPIAQ